MHALLVTLGTDGDINPYVALGERLLARGHRVTLATSEHFRQAALARGMTFETLVTDAEMREVLEEPAFWHPIKAGAVAARWGMRLLPRQLDLVLRLAEPSDTVIVANPGVLAARIAQERLSRPLASVVLQPWMIPSLTAPPVMPGGLTLPRWAPRPAGALYWRVIDAIGTLLVGRGLNALRARHGLPTVRRLFRWWLSPQRVIGLFPDWYGAPQADWPPQLRLAGFPMSDGRDEGALPPDLAAHIDAGAPPIAFTFGTGMLHAGQLFRAAAEACRALGARALFVTRYPQQLPAPLPDGVRAVAFAPFRALFPRCAAIVHHGGIGTSAKALAAGVPQLIAPFAYDQRDNGVRVERLGAGTWLRGRRRRTADFSRALARVLAPSTRERAREIAAGRDTSDGIARACAWLEEMAD